MSQALPMPLFSVSGLGRGRLARLHHKLRLILWWTATRQLHIQFGFWLRARRLRRAPRLGSRADWRGRGAGYRIAAGG